MGAARNAPWLVRTGLACALLSLTGAAATPTLAGSRTPSSTGTGLIAFVSSRPTADPGSFDRSEIRVVGPNGRGSHKLTRPGQTDHGPSWSPDGTRILFWRNAGGRNGDDDLYVADADGSRQRMVLLDRDGDVHDDLTWSAAWSPDGRKIAFERNYQLYVMNADGSGRRRLTPCEVGCAEGIAWSPDGRRIAFLNTSVAHVYVVNVAGGGFRKLADDGGADLAWSPDGTRLLYTGRIGVVNGEVYVVDIARNRAHNVTRSPADDDSASWSPDGRKIVFVKHRLGELRHAVYVVGADGDGQQNLSGTRAYDDAGPAWSPDGRRIAFARTGRCCGLEDREIFVMDADGTNQRRLTNDSFPDDGPTWQPRRHR